jgi:DNA-binding transcriptional LysR family regulator
MSWLNRSENLINLSGGVAAKVTLATTMDPRFTLDQLLVLDAIARRGTFAAAAKELHRVTSAVSYGVRALEAALGVALFAKRGRNVALTSAGAQVLEGARDVLARARDVARLGQQLADEWEPRLTVVLDGVLPMPPVMRALRTFSRRGVATQVRVLVEYLSGVSKRFEDEGADVMLALDYAPDARFVTRALPPVEMVLLAHRAHPMHSRRRPHDRKSLSDFVEVTVADSGDGTPNKLRRLRVGSPQVLEVSDFYSKRVALRSGVGFGWLPLHLARRSMEAGVLLEAGFEGGDRHTLSPEIVWRRDAPLGRGAKLFLSLLDAKLGHRR